MPYTSSKQRAYLHATHPGLAAKWDAEHPDQSELPRYAHGNKSTSPEVAAEFRKEKAMDPERRKQVLAKVASHVTPDLVHRIAKSKGVPNNDEHGGLMYVTQKVSGQKHLDACSPTDLREVAKRLLVSYEMDNKERAAALAKWGLTKKAAATSKLVEHAERELRLAGFFKRDKQGGTYDGMLGPATVRVVKAFAKERHSGGSANLTRSLLNKLLNFEPLTPVTSKPSEWADVRAMWGKPQWQNKRDSRLFSDDRGKTWRNVEDKVRVKQGTLSAR